MTKERLAELIQRKEYFEEQLRLGVLIGPLAKVAEDYTLLLKELENKQRMLDDAREVLGCY